MAWYAPDSFRVQGLLIGVASLCMAVLAVVLVQDAWQSTRRALAEEARQQCVRAVRELQEQFADRASLLEGAEAEPRFEAEDLSLRGLSAAVLRSYEGIEGGFLLGAQQRLAGRSGPMAHEDTAGLSAEAVGLIRSLAAQPEAATAVASGETVVGDDVLVAAVAALPAHNAVAWTLKQLPGANDPAAQRRRWWIAALVLSALLGLGAIVSISIRLRQGVDALNTGLERLESDFNYRLPAMGGDLGRVALAINRMAGRRSVLEATLRRQERLAALDRVVAGVAHEIRNPLNSLALTLELLHGRVRKGVASGEEVRQAIEEVDRLERILARYLAFGRPEPEHRSVRELGPMMERALRVVEEAARRKQVRLEAPPFTADTLRAEVDAVAFEQVLINLLLNAIEASPEGGTVVLSAEDHGGRVRITVRDQGAGIAPDIRDHIFDPYFTTKQTGTGLGLAVSREIIGQHGGTLDFDSSGGGTTFVVTLPAARSNA